MLRIVLRPVAAVALILLAGQLLLTGVVRSPVAGDTLAYGVLFAVEDAALLDQIQRMGPHRE
ncbi:hypothetical protein [Roseomonas elaeocarpi]|uniref:ABC transporter permease n=1 Tax=Roseomonas elaeocarpi TaxID=907779 RepID=A0ABV6JRD6_9PROT